jgi:hypothetical protein
MVLGRVIKRHQLFEEPQQKKCIEDGVMIRRLFFFFFLAAHFRLSSWVRVVDSTENVAMHPPPFRLLFIAILLSLKITKRNTFQLSFFSRHLPFIIFLRSFIFLLLTSIPPPLSLLSYIHFPTSDSHPAT